MAVCTQQDALSRLLASRRERTRQTSIGDAEALVAGVAVVELQCSGRTRVSAQDASSSRVLDQPFFHSPAPRYHGLGSALETSVSAGAGAAEERNSMAATFRERSV
jgi:hypothetical protein